MSKEAAMAMMTGQPVNNVNPSILTPDVPTSGGVSTPAEINPGVEVAQKAKLESDRAAIFARKEAKLQKERQEFAQRQTEFEKERIEARAFLERINNFEAKRKQDPIAALKDIGFTETEIFNFMAEGKGEPKEPTAKEIAEQIVNEKMTDFEKKQQEIAMQAQKSRDDGIIATHKKTIAHTIEANKDKFEYLAFNGAVGAELVEDYINAVLDAEDKLIPYSEACEDIEKYYEGQYEEMSKLKKRQNGAETPKSGEATQLDTKAQPTSARTRTITDHQGKPIPPPTTRTLTNRTTATVASTRPLNETSEQKRDRLINKLRNGG